jgi:hypothetical protein
VTRFAATVRPEPNRAEARSGFQLQIALAWQPLSPLILAEKMAYFLAATNKKDDRQSAERGQEFAGMEK